jgi:ADP-dependent NAD(P)H-hydrate dehydratase / NAD(P)H-hydrate epimerase
LLAGRKPADDRVADVRERAEQWGAVVHLKGRRAMTASPHGNVWINTSGNPGAATGGTGDVLTGIVGSLVAQGMMPEAATWSGAYLHGLASDIVAARLGMRSLAAGDLPEALPRAFAIVSRATHSPSKLRTVL